MEDATEEEKKIATNMIIVALWCTQIEIYGECRRELKSNLLINSFRLIKSFNSILNANQVICG